jgi:hypothetical protein
MPKRKTHDDISLLLLGKPFSNVSKTLDLPAKFLGGSHRRLLHSVPESFIVGVLLTGELDGGIAGILHVVVDATDSSAKKEIRKLIRKGGGRACPKKKTTQKRKNPCS